MKRPTNEEVIDLIHELRELAPKRPLTYGESLQVARLQAAHIRAWTDTEHTAEINLIWLFKQQAVPVHLVPSYMLDEESGLTTDRIGNRLRIFINQKEPPYRQRFTLLHEFKHALDFPDRAVLHANLGTWDEEHHRKLIERVANEFAGQVLMPAGLIKSAWLKCQDLSLMANLFDVSPEAMKTRLEILGLIDGQGFIPRDFYRLSGPLPPVQPLHTMLGPSQLERSIPWPPSPTAAPPATTASATCVSPRPARSRRTTTPKASPSRPSDWPSRTGPRSSSRRTSRNSSNLARAPRALNTAPSSKT